MSPKNYLESCLDCLSDHVDVVMLSENEVGTHLKIICRNCNSEWEEWVESDY